MFHWKWKWMFLPLLLLAACAQGTPARVFVSPDRRHVLVAPSHRSLYSLDAVTGDEVARLDHLALDEGPTFSGDGAVLLAGDERGHLVALRVAGGRPVDLGPALDAGALSPDGARVAFTTRSRPCTGPLPAVAMPARCADLVVVPSAGGEPLTVAAGVAVRSYRFAGNDVLLFVDANGALQSVRADGSAPPFELAPPVGVLAHNGFPIAATFAVTPDGSRVLVAGRGGSWLSSPGGGTPLWVSGGFTTLGDVAADGRTLLLVESDPPYSVLGGKVFDTPQQRPGAVRLQELSLDNPTGPRQAVESKSRLHSFNAEGRPVHLRLSPEDLVRSEADGSETVLLAAAAIASQGPVVEVAVSPDHRWVGLAHRPGERRGACASCLTWQFVSAIDGATWTPRDGRGEPLPLWRARWSPDGARLLFIGPVQRLGSPTQDAGGALLLSPAGGGRLEPLDDNVDQVAWVDAHHAAVERWVDHRGHPAGVFVRALPPRAPAAVGARPAPGRWEPLAQKAP